MENIVEVKNLNFSYKNNDNYVLENVSLKVKRGEYLVVIGPNGGGKTTLIKLLLGLLEPTQGEVSIFGQNPKKVYNKIGYMPQRINYKLYFPITVLDTVVMGLEGSDKYSRWSSNQEKEKAALDALSRLDMVDFKNNRLNELSGGQLQRVYLARAIVSEPELIIMDEPTSSIDPYASFCFFSFLEGLKSNITLIVVSHNMNIIASKISSIACVNKFLLYNNEPVLTKDMLDITYGTHDAHTCSIGAYFAEEQEHINSIKNRR